MRLIAPGIFKTFGHTAAAFRETGIAHLARIAQHLSTRRGHRLDHLRSGHTRQSLITLAMVIGTDIEKGMVATVVPADYLAGRVDFPARPASRLTATDETGQLGQQPTA